LAISFKDAVRKILGYVSNTPEESVMRVGFIGLGRMGHVMTRRLLDGGHEVGVYNRTAEKTKSLLEIGAKPTTSIKEVANFGEVVFTMLTDDVAVMEVVGKSGGLRESLPKGAIHICAGTHSVAAMRKLEALHADAGQVLIATPVLGRPEVVTAGRASMVVGGPKDSVERCRPLFTAIAGRVVEAGPAPVSATAIKLANNFVLGCAIEAMGEGFALVRKYGVVPEVFYGVLTEGLFACGAYKVYGKLITENATCRQGNARSWGSRTPASCLPPRKRSACLCRVGTSGATGSSGPSPMTKASTTGR
jgi:3-hydroxyisobutyrate dehydrogenase-like beta-hydroxyacid dehydrogenase